MAKITLTVDTEEKSMEVAIDGNTLENVTDFIAYTNEYDGDKPSVSIMQRKDEENGLKSYTRTSTAESKEAKRAIEKGLGKKHNTIAGLVIHQDSPELENDISEFLSQN